MCGRWVGELGTEPRYPICDFYGEGDSEEYENQWIYVLRVAEEINETLKREKQRKFKLCFLLHFVQLFSSAKILFGDFYAHKSKRHDWRIKKKEKKMWWRFMKWNLYVSLFLFSESIKYIIKQVNECLIFVKVCLEE